MTEQTDAADDAARTRELVGSVRRFLDDVVYRFSPGDSAEPLVSEAVSEHLGVDVRALAVVTEEVPGHQVVDLDLALDRLAARGGGERVLGVGGGEQRDHTGFAEILSNRFGEFRVAAVDRVNLPTGPDSSHRAVAFGVRLLRVEDRPVALLERRGSPHGRGGGVEVVAEDGELVARLLADLRADMLAGSVLRGQVLTFTGSPFDHHSTAGITFLARPDVPAQDVVLPEGALERVVRHVVGVGSRSARLLAAGQHLKRGVLLYGPPGTGKTLTVRHLVGRSEGTTVVLLSGEGLAHVTTAAHLARAMQPALVVLEDCDLVAHDRGEDPGERPLLFRLLDAMDGLDGDADVAFLLTTNRADLLERALAQRPGRVDLAVEVPLPDEAARRRLYRLYARGLPLSGRALDEAAARSEGVTASFAKELLRRAVLRGAEADREVADDDLRASLAELLSDAEVLTRTLLGGGSQEGPTGAYL